MERYLTPRDVARILVVSLETLRRWRLEQPQALPFTKIGRQVRYKASDLEKFISAERSAA